LEMFWKLHILTRRRHHAPPQPKTWFANLIHYFGEALKIRVVLQDGKALAAILTLRHKDTITYKYGCSDARVNTFGASHLLICKTIQEAKGNGLSVLDLGRTDLPNEGLAIFKDRFGGKRSVLTYSSFCSPQNSREQHADAGSTWIRRTATTIVSSMPTPIFCGVGRLIYKHIG
jgi:CelD/BcsL family acetyltransferase involved in cellulose biosynthesis